MFFLGGFRWFQGLVPRCSHTATHQPDDDVDDDRDENDGKYRDENPHEANAAACRAILNVPFITGAISWLRIMRRVPEALRC